MSGSAMRTRADCRLCGSTRLPVALSLQETPPANAFVRAEARATPQARYPLEVHLCEACGHLQLLDVVDPEVLFREYVYVASTSPVSVEHFRRYAQAMREMTAMPAGSQVIEFGSNDGLLLRFFQDAGMRVLGVDPARAIAQEATRRGIETIPGFFDAALAKRLRAEGWRPALVAANNVFAHADDLHTMVEGVACLLKPDGVFSFEVSYLVDVFEKILFDTIYHEHLSYHSVKPLVGLFKRHGMELIDAVRVEAQGGSLRGIAQLRGGGRRRHPRVDELIALEESLGLYNPESYRRLSERIQQLKASLVQLLRELKRGGRRIIGYGAPAKATTLMFHFGIGPETLEYLIDENPLKQGLFSPGHHIPVVPPSHLCSREHRPDYALILAWNFADSIISKWQAFRDQGGHFIVPVPSLKVV